MKKNNARKGITLALAAMMTMAVMTGCGDKTADAVAISESATPTTDSVNAGYVQALKADSQAVYFTKGVYASYEPQNAEAEKLSFYVFADDGSGYTDDAETGESKFFTYEMEEGAVKFLFGAEDPIEEIFTVDAFENGKVTGYFEKNHELILEPVSDADPENFSAVNYVFASHGEDLLYTNANGWSVRYNPSCIAVNEGGPLTTFVYTGDCAGTCMITVTYDVGKDAKAAADELAKSWGDEAKVTECIFPPTEDVPGFYVDAHPGQMGPGLYENAFVRDYMDGYLVFEFTEHMCGDDAIDIPVSDNLALIIDSLKFN